MPPTKPSRSSSARRRLAIARMGGEQFALANLSTKTPPVNSALIFFVYV